MATTIDLCEALAAEWSDQADAIERATHGGGGKPIPRVRRLIAAETLRQAAHQLTLLVETQRRVHSQGERCPRCGGKGELIAEGTLIGFHTTACYDERDRERVRIALARAETPDDGGPYCVNCHAQLTTLDADYCQTCWPIGAPRPGSLPAPL